MSPDQPRTALWSGPAPLAQTAPEATHPNGGSRAGDWLLRRGLRALLAVHAAARRVARALGRRARPAADGRCDLVFVLSTQAESWAASHLAPLAASSRCGTLTVVTESQVPAIPRVRVVGPPGWLRRVVGTVPARLLTFTAVALRERPQFVGGFHLQMNGLAALIGAALAGARSLYFCVGGPLEIEGGGAGSENRLFGRLAGPDAIVERQLLDATCGFDGIITMGSRAATYLQQRGVTVPCHVIPGGLEAALFQPRRVEPDIDLLFVGRLAAIKRVDLFLQASACVARARAALRVVVVGDGPLRGQLEQLAADLGLEETVTFAGHQRHVGPWLQRSKIFMLTSESEGVSLSLMEAMASAVVPVVADVGDLADLVRDGENGHLIVERTAEAFAGPAIRLLDDAPALGRLAEAARHTASRHSIEATSRRWDGILTI